MSTSLDLIDHVQLGRFLRRVSCSRNEILEYDHETRSLTIWPWCVNEFRVLFNVVTIIFALGPQRKPQGIAWTLWL